MREFIIFDHNFFILLEFKLRANSNELAEFYEEIEIKKIKKFGIDDDKIHQNESVTAFRSMIKFYTSHP